MADADEVEVGYALPQGASTVVEKALIVLEDRSTALASSGSCMRWGRSRLGTDSTHCRIGTIGTTLSLRWSANSAMRRFVHDGQTQRPLQLKATSRSWQQSAQRARASPNARMPQVRYRRNSCSVQGGRCGTSPASAIAR